ncbi:nif-specific transcriptional activator NifA [Rhizobium sp. KAs_5_22]|uniref:nif-specific transcriptional activator NifA n=1 Tax=Ciceribacter selenitireducens TaxID=448181 RepID=UPI0004BA8CB4|nr:nif-specific transcriptional activator NifA [Ciceribacter selenitireducens]PPJ49287.1 nif-specific transcriptional activator NifA [Rhizobium sp. KAs_5_22]
MNRYVEHVSPPGRDHTLSEAAAKSSRRATVSLSGIYEISKVLAEPARLEITLANVVNILSSFLQMRHGALIVLDDGGLPEIVATAGYFHKPGEDHFMPIPQTVIDQIVATGTPLVVPDTSRSHLFPGSEPGVCFIGVPVKANHTVLGTLSIDRTRKEGADFTLDDDMRFLTMVANLAGQTIRLHRILSEDRQRLIDEQRRLEKSFEGSAKIRPRRTAVKTGRIVGESLAVKNVLDVINIVARTNSTVLLRGESGTGKELFAQTIHELSPRHDKPFIKLNCAALPETVLESELFGHEKGAFTGAISQRAGRFELAHGGTLLLDEIGEISAAFQAKLLRVLQEGEFERVGGNKTLKVDVRLICATNRDLEEAVRKGDFRADLYYRISVVPVTLPPLRERPGDIPRLAEEFLERFNRQNSRHLSFSRTSLDLISRCYFPGNVRELENCVQRTATLTRSETIAPNDFACSTGQCLSALLWKGNGKVPTNAIDVLASGQTLPGGMPAPLSHGHDADSISAGKACNPDDPACPANGGRLTERDRLVDAMERSGWVQAKAARILGLTPRQVGYALRRHDIPVKKF